MTKQDVSFRAELRDADDAMIEDAIAHADPMVLRGLIYQLTGDPEVAATGVKTVLAGYFDVAAPATEADVALLRRKGVAFLKAYRDSGAGDIDSGPHERLAVSLGLMMGRTLEGEDLRYHVEELALDPAVRLHGPVAVEVVRRHVRVDGDRGPARQRRQLELGQFDDDAVVRRQFR